MANATQFARATHAFFVGDLSAGTKKPTEMLQFLRHKDERATIFVFTDQILDQADISILVKTDHGGRYLSPLEVVLNAIYGYDLLVWTAKGFEVVPAGSDDPAALMRLLIRHLDDAALLGDEWQAAAMQTFRTLANRKYNAKRKIRFFRSAVINAFRDTPTAQAGLELLARADELDQMVEQGIAA